jgi:pyruvate kinase
MACARGPFSAGPVQCNARSVRASSKHKTTSRKDASEAQMTTATLQAATDEERLRWLSERLHVLAGRMRGMEHRLGPRLSASAQGWHSSALNLAHYVGLRNEDIRELQSRLSELGLSSLGRSEPGVMANLEAVLRLVERLRNAPSPALVSGTPTQQEGRSLLAAHADALFGPARPERSVRIMVTMPSEAAQRPELIHTLVAGGMDVMRVNCAHDDGAAWRAMSRHLRAANSALQRGCRVQLDLPGPKLRTGAFVPGPKVVRVAPERDALGNVVEPGRLRLQAEGAAPEEGAGLTVPEAWLCGVTVGDRITFRDHRGKHRALHVVARDADGCSTIGMEPAWLTEDTELSRRTRQGEKLTCRPAQVPALSGALHLDLGQRLRLTGPDEPGREGSPAALAVVSCTMPEAIAALRPGHRVWFDDGKLGGVVEEADGRQAVLLMLEGRSHGLTLRADKGINLPDTHLDVPPLGPADLSALDVACEAGDLVALSYCRSDADVRALHAALEARHASLGVVLKIENREGFENLSSILLTAMERAPFGVMIARGDLAVECGFARLAELQEEMLCLCEAAHAPVIWATQVLETAARKGFPSRAEVTDAATGERAECVMLNKGPYVAHAVKTLDDILRRMASHQRKKTPLFRRLRSLGLE